ncbi:hypothetical protein NFI96_014212 [Prochilodus magdalenae]|nr:hypothetical protein NFI96_014212 [Prochilodus magdalenae]
MMITSA